MKKWRTRTGAACGAAFLGLAIPACGPGGQDEGTVQKPTSAPNEEMRGVTIRNFVVGDTRWVLQADSAAVFRAKKRIEALPVEVNFFEEDRHVSVLTAHLGILNQSTDDLEARGDVKVVTDEGTTLTTDVLFWDHHRALIHTESFVRIEKDGDVLTGRGLEADPGLDRIDIKESVRGSLQDPDALLGEHES